MDSVSRKHRNDDTTTTADTRDKTDRDDAGDAYAWMFADNGPAVTGPFADRRFIL